MKVSTVLAQTTDGGSVPSEGGGVLVWIIVAAVIVGLYLITRRSQRRANETYQNRREAAEDLRRNDPDMRRED